LEVEVGREKFRQGVPTGGDGKHIYGHDNDRDIYKFRTLAEDYDKRRVMKRQKSNMALLCGAAAIILGAFMILLTDGSEGKVSQLVIGTYGEHIYTYSFDHKQNKFEFQDKAEAHNASYALTGMMQDGRTGIYAVSECGEESGVYSFEIDASDSTGKGNIVQTSHKQQTGADPCFVLLYDDGKYMMTADYSGGSISAFPIVDGVVGDLCASLKFEGRGPVTDRQESSHIHQLKELPSQSEKWILASDLGADVIRLIRPEATEEELTLEHVQDIPCPSGSGPRHMEFNREGTILYCIAEISGEVLVYDICHDGDVPTFTLKQQIQADEVNAGGSADIHIHPSGRWLYTSHRLKNDGIAAFHIFPDGTLKKMDYTITGRHPRNFMITDDGEYLLVACRDDKCVQVFQILPTGRLARTSTILRFDEDKPVCLMS
jgi:6-phosphogluconolactonase (cycloisomerase 2 family)